MRKTTVTIACLTLSIFSVFAQKTIQIQNPIDEDRIDLIAIPYHRFTKHFGVDSIFTIKDKSTGAVFLHQLEKLGTKQPQNVLIQIPIKSKEKVTLIVQKEKAPPYKSKTYARYVPERKDDFAWENDVVAFRMYGKALEGTNEDAQGIDFWAKRTNELIINDWYKGNDYHVDHGQGLDYYSVGQTLGAGDIALYIDNQVYFTKHYRQHTVLDNGPLRTSFRLEFEPQEIAGSKFSLAKTITIDAGQQFSKIKVDLNNENSAKTPIVVGLARRNEQNPKVDFDKDDYYLAYWEPAIKDFGQTGTAVILPNNKVEFIQDNPKQFLLKTIIKNRKPLTYYSGAAWNKTGKITNAEQWFDFVDDFSETTVAPLKVKLK